MPPYPTKKAHKKEKGEEEEVALRRRAPGPAAGSSILTMNGNQRRTATDRGLRRAHLHLFLLPLLLIFWPFARPSSLSLFLSLPPSIFPCCGFLFEKNYNQLFKTPLSHANLWRFFLAPLSKKKCSIVWFFSLSDTFNIFELSVCSLTTRTDKKDASSCLFQELKMEVGPDLMGLNADLDSNCLSSTWFMIILFHFLSKNTCWPPDLMMHLTCELNFNF